MITVNASGVLKTLGEISANDGGVLKKMSTVHANDSGVLRQIFSAGKPISNSGVGSTIKIKVNGTAKDFIIVHKGLPSSLYDSSCDGIWVLMKDLYTVRIWSDLSEPNGYYNSFKDSDIKAYLNGAFYNLLDANAKKAIKTVKIPYINGGGKNGPITSGSSGLSCNVFLLSGYEVGWTTSTHSNFPADGACLSYFSGLSTTDSKRIAYYNGSAECWWLRSPNRSDNVDVMLVDDKGYYNRWGTHNQNYCVRPAFVLNNTAKIDNNNVVVG